jgi:predicted transcriptional regulator
MSGWVKIHRQILEWEWYDDINTCRLFFHLLIKANHKERNYKGKVVQVGETLTGLDKLSYETNLSVQQIRTSLNKLKSTNEITINSTSQGTVIKVVNYEKYQVATSEPTDEQQTTNKRSTTNKNDKKEKKILFDKFWVLYGKSADKKKCMDKFILLSDSEIDLIFETLPIYLLKTPDVQYRKNPLTYINGKCWNDIDLNNPQIPSNPYNLPPVVWEG